MSISAREMPAVTAVFQPTVMPSIAAGDDDLAVHTRRGMAAGRVADGGQASRRSAG